MVQKTIIKDLTVKDNKYLNKLQQVFALSSKLYIIYAKRCCSRQTSLAS